MAAPAPSPPNSIFSAASPALRAAIEDTARELTLAPGAMLFGQGDAADAFYILDAGEIEISVLSPGGRKLSIEMMTPGEIFGEIGLFAGHRTATATATGPARLRAVRRADLMAALRADPELAIEMIEILCGRLRANVEMFEERTFQPLPTRVARRLLHLIEKLSPPDGAIPISQAELADFAGATRESVAKTLAGWRVRKIVALSRGVVQVLDAETLADIAEGAED